MTAKTNIVKAKDKVRASAKDSPAVHRKPVADDTAAAVTSEHRAGKDRRDDDRRQEEVPVVVERRQMERRAKVNRRRQIDPTTCERDYTPEEIDFMTAMDAYKRQSGRMFPTCSEILEVIKKLGYARQSAAPSCISLMPEPTLTDIAQQTV